MKKFLLGCFIVIGLGLASCGDSDTDSTTVVKDSTFVDTLIVDTVGVDTVK